MNIGNKFVSFFIALIMVAGFAVILAITDASLNKMELDEAERVYASYGLTAVADSEGNLTVNNDLNVFGDINTLLTADSIIFTDANGTLTTSSNLTYNGEYIDSSMGRSYDYVFASSNASNRLKAQADAVLPAAGWETIVQTVIDEIPGGTFAFVGNTISKGTVTPLTISSDNVTIKNFAELTFAANVGANATFLSAVDVSSFSFIGGIIDGNKANQSTGNQTAIYLDNVSGSTIDVTMQNFKGYYVNNVNPGVGNTIINRQYPNITDVTASDAKIENMWTTVSVMDETWTQYEGTVTPDTDVYFSGTRSIKFVSGGTRANGRMTFSGGLDLSDMTMGVRMKFANPSDVSYMVIAFEAPNISNLLTIQFSDIDLLPANEWLLLTPPPFVGSSTGSPDITSVYKMYIQIYHNTGKQITAWVDEVLLARKSNQEGHVILRFDDGWGSVYDNALPLMDQYGYRGNMGIVGSLIDTSGYMTIDEAVTLSNKGWSMTSHSWSHLNSNSLTPAESEDEICKNLDFLQTNQLGSGSRFYYYPFGYAAQDYYNIVRKYHNLAFCYDTFPITGPSGSPYILATTKDMHSGSGVPSVEYIQKAKEAGVDLVFLFHQVNTVAGPTTYATADFSSFMDNLAEANANVITVDEYYDNIAFTGKTDLIQQSGDTLQISSVIDHSDFTDGGTTNGTYAFSEKVPEGYEFISANVEFLESFKDTVGNNSQAFLTIGDGSDIDRFYQTAAPGDDIWDSTTTLYWGSSDIQGIAKTTGKTSFVITLATDADMTDLISGTGSQGIMIIKLLFRKL